MIERGLQAQPDDAQLLAMRSEHQALVDSARATQARRPATRAPSAQRGETRSEDSNPVKRVWNNLFGN
ncbi:hypothetical protein D3C78_1842850 [compost metagenome]